MLGMSFGSYVKKKRRPKWSKILCSFSWYQMQGPGSTLRVLLAITEGMNSILELLFDYEAACDILKSSQYIYGITED